MSDEEIEKLAELIFQKILAKQEEYLDEVEQQEATSGWLIFDPITNSWNATYTPEPNKGNSKELFTQRLVALNIEKQELLANEDYDGLIKLQKRIDEIKEQLKKYKD
jgi:hypothetical protein